MRRNNPIEPIREGDYCLIPLTQGKFAKLDLVDYPKVSQHLWCIVGGYAKRNAKVNPRQNNYMHRFLMEPPHEMDVDHINGDRSDNRRFNLRICTRSQNYKNAGIHSHSTTGYKGVFKIPGGKFGAQIMCEGKWYYLGCFVTKEEAALAYNEGAKKYHGEFARLNVLKESDRV